MTPDKPFSAASERNREPILAFLRDHFADRRRVLEIGSGTGQHAVHFGAALAHLRWQTGDLPENHAGIRAWLDAAALPNVLAPVVVDADAPRWGIGPFDAAFSANTLHIMGWPQVERTFAHLGEVLAPDAVLVVYGPFRVCGAFTSDSNASFDASLKARGAHMGVRDLEAVEALARSIGLARREARPMPANNFCVAWARTGDGPRPAAGTA